MVIECGFRWGYYLFAILFCRDGIFVCFFFCRFSQKIIHFSSTNSHNIQSKQYRNSIQMPKVNKFSKSFFLVFLPVIIGVSNFQIFIFSHKTKILDTIFDQIVFFYSIINFQQQQQYNDGDRHTLTHPHTHTRTHTNHLRSLCCFGFSSHHDAI